MEMGISFGGKTKRCPKLPRVGVNREMYVIYIYYKNKNQQKDISFYSID
jgi:hypothetical protein